MEGLRTRLKNTEVSHQCSVNRITSLSLLATLLLAQPRRLLAFAARAPLLALGPSVSCFSAGQPLVCTGAWGFPLHMQDLTFLFTELQKVLDKVLVNRFYWSMEIPLTGSTPMLSVTPPCFVLSASLKYEASNSMERQEKRLALEREPNRFNNPQNPSSCSSLNEADKRLLQGWCCPMRRPYGWRHGQQKLEKKQNQPIPVIGIKPV